jgi:mannose-6-phosphate isomerase-like protein (cupin superfamily)
MKKVFSVEDLPWKNLRGLPGARGFEFKALYDADYSTAFNSELVRLEPGDHSVPHVEPWSHLLYFLSGKGDITISDVTSSVAPGTVCLVKAGERHSLRNLGTDDMIVFTIYDPPRTRPEQPVVKPSNRQRSQRTGQGGRLFEGRGIG